MDPANSGRMQGESRVDNAASTAKHQPPQIDTSMDKETNSASSEPSPTTAVPGHVPANDVSAKKPQDGAPTSGDEEKAPAYQTELERSKLKTAILMFALCTAVFLAALDITIITTALPVIAEHFQSSSGFAWIGSAYLLGAASSTAVWAKVSDIFGRKPIILLANVVFFVGTLVSALSTSIGMLIAARAIQGIGGGGLLTLVNISISDLFSMRKRGMYYGMVGFVWALASAIGPLVGGAFSEKVSWRWCFYINIPFQAISFAITVFFLKIYRPKTAIGAGLLAIDWLGCLLIVGGIVMLLLGLQLGGVTMPWDSATVICLIVFGIFTLILFALNEWRFAKYPLIPLHIFNKRSNVASFATSFCHGFVFIGGSFYLPLFFQTVLGHGPIISGVLTLANVLPLSLMSMATGIFIRKTGQYLPPIWFGMTFMTIGFGLFLDFGTFPSLGKIIGFQIIAGLGTGPLFQAPLIAIQSQIPPRDIASAVGTFQLIRNVATSISIVIGSVIFQNAVTKRYDTLAASLGPQTAQQLSGFQAAASAQVINRLPAEQQLVAKTVFAQGLHEMWFMYVAFAALGLVFSFFISRQTLTREHEEMKTGLAAEEEKRVDRQERRKSRKASNGEVLLSPGVKAEDNVKEEV